METHIEAVRIDYFFEGFNAISLQEALTSLYPFFEACVPAPHSIFLPPIFFTQVASLQFVIEILKL